MLNDAAKELAGYLQLLLRELGEELVLLKHVPQHTHKEVLCRRGEDVGEGGGGEVGGGEGRGGGGEF